MGLMPQRAPDELGRNEERPAMTRFLMAAMVAGLLSCGSAVAQIGGIGTSPGASPLGMTSPLGIGPAPAVAPTGIPLGATDLASPGVSPMTSGISPLGPATGSACSGLGSPTSSGIATSAAGTSGSTNIFDGGGTAGTASGTCAGITSSPLSGPAASASSPTGMGAASTVGRSGIPLGSTELGAGGLSPPPDVLTPNPSAPSSTIGATIPCPTTGMSPMSGMSSGSC
jgi:hypothetical protein